MILWRFHVWKKWCPEEESAGLDLIPHWGLDGFPPFSERPCDAPERLH